jgi:hypothetical protein
LAQGPVDVADSLSGVPLCTLSLLDIFEFQQSCVLVLVAHATLETHHHRLDIQPAQAKQKNSHKRWLASNQNKYYPFSALFVIILHALETSKRSHFGATKWLGHKKESWV